MKKSKPLVSIISIGWNNKRFLKDFFDSVHSQTYENIEVFFTDNNSDDDSVEYVKKNYKKVNVHKNSSNKGFAEAHNQGIRKATGKYFFIVNVDTKHEKNLLELLVDHMESNPTVGSMTPKLLTMDDHSLINGAGGDMILRSGDNVSRGFYMKDTEQFEDVEDIFGPSGAALFVRKEVIDEIGMLDRGLHTYYEDVDFNHRVNAAGWRSVYYPKAIMYHYQSSGIDDFNPRKVFLLNRNKYYVLLKNYPIKLMWFYKSVLIRSWFALLKHCKLNNHMWVWVKINLSLLLKLPEILLKRIWLVKVNSKARTNKLIRWIEKHEQTYIDTNVQDNVRRYLKDLETRD